MTPSVILRYNGACYQLVIVTPSVILLYNRVCYQLVIVTPSEILRYDRSSMLSACHCDALCNIAL